MKPIIFHNMAEMQALAKAFLDAGVFDDFAVSNLPGFFTNGMYWEIESIPGFVSLNGVIPGRDATLYIVTLDGLNARERSNGHRLEKGQYRRFLTELTKWGEGVFRDFGLLRLTAVCRWSNKPSRILLHRLGFEEEGVIRDGSRVRGIVDDLLTFGILREEVLHGIQSVGGKDGRTGAVRPVVGTAAGEPCAVAAGRVDGGRHEEPVESPTVHGREGSRAGWWRGLFGRVSAG